MQTREEMGLKLCSGDRKCNICNYCARLDEDTVTLLENPVARIDTQSNKYTESCERFFDNFFLSE